MLFHRTIAQPCLFAGIGLREPLFDAVLSTRPDVGFLEVPAESCMSESPALWRLEMLRRDYPVSLHGVALSLGGVDGPDGNRLRRLREIVDHLEPLLVSDHLSLDDGELSCTVEALDRVSAQVAWTQDMLRRPILIENASSDRLSLHSTMGEAEFLAEIVRRTGCGVLCDIGNLDVSSHGLGLDPISYLDTLPAERVCEIHLDLRHGKKGGTTIATDRADSPAEAALWGLYASAVQRFGPVATMIEWEGKLPTLDGLVAWAHAADYRMERALINRRRRVAA